MPSQATESKYATMTAHSDFFLKLGDIKGESQDDKHKGEIQVISWQWAASQPSGSGAVGAGAGVGKVQFSEIHVTKLLDAASPKLMLACASGSSFSEVTLTCRKAGGSQVEYMKLKLEGVAISKYEVAAGDTELKDTLPVETVSFNFSKINFAYTAQDSSGNPGANTMTGWDRLLNKKI